MTIHKLTPQGVDYLRTDIVYKQLTQGSRPVTLEADTSAAQTPAVLLDGSGNATLQGALTVTDSTPAVDMPIFRLPNGIIPYKTAYFPVAVLRAGAYVPNAIKISAEGSVIDSVAVDAAGNYETLPTLTISGPGSGQTLASVMKAVANAPAAAGTGYDVADTITLTGGTFTSATVLTITNTKLVSAAVDDAGTGYAPTDTITLAGGTFSSPATLTVATTELVSADLNAPGSGYEPADTVTLAGGTPSTKAILTVTNVQLASLAINAAGTGYGIGDTITLAGGTASVAAIVTVLTIGGSGEVLTFSITTPGVYSVTSASFTQDSTSGSGTGATFQTGLFGINVFSISTPGSYTANSATFTQDSTDGAGTGATFNAGLFGVDTFTISTAGVYTVQATSFTQGSTSGSGTGATFDTGLFGVNALTISTPGSYTVLPANPVAQGATSGGGTGATFTMGWGFLSVTVSAGGTGFDDNSAIVILGGGGSGGGELTLVLAASTNGHATLILQPQENDIVYLDAVHFITQSYS